MRLGFIITRSFFTSVFFTVFFSFAKTSAQETWSLQRCVEYARNSSISLKQSQNSIALAKLVNAQNRLNRLPNLSGSASGGWQFGRTIDPTTNTFNNQTIAFNSFGLNAGATLFSGGFINNSIKQSEIDVKVAEQDAAAAFNNLALSVANAYLNILLSEEQLSNAERRRKLSEDQLGQTDKLIAAGSIPANDRLDVLAQMANDDQAIVQARNAIDLNYLTLRELMQLDPAVDFKIEQPKYAIPTDADPMGTTFGEVYGRAVNTQPQIMASELRVQSAEVGVELAKAGYYPTLSLFAGMDSRWSDASKIYSQELVGYDKVYNPIYINTDDLGLGLGEQVVNIGTEVPKYNLITKDYAYIDQLRDNFGQSLGASLRIPIYSNGSNSINQQRAEVGILSAKLNSDLQKQQLKNDVQQAIAGARAGQLTLEASQKASESAKVAFENAEKRFQLGTINNLQLITARNTYDTAETNLSVAKYDYLFRLKILDFYLGKEIKLD